VSTIYWGALHKRVARHFLRASADWYVIYDRTQGIDTANSETTRISTFILDASPVSRTIGIQDTFWTTSKVWISLILGKATAYTVKALRIRAAI